MTMACKGIADRDTDTSMSIGTTCVAVAAGCSAADIGRPSAGIGRVISGEIGRAASTGDLEQDRQIMRIRASGTFVATPVVEQRAGGFSRLPCPASADAMKEMAPMGAISRVLILGPSPHRPHRGGDGDANTVGSHKHTGRPSRGDIAARYRRQSQGHHPNRGDICGLPKQLSA
jgi:hypothetical protein